MVHWRRKWQPTPVFLLGKPHEQYEKAKDITLKDELPRSIGAQYATGGKQRNSSRRNEEAGLNQKQHPVLNVSGGETKV